MPHDAAVVISDSTDPVKIWGFIDTAHALCISPNQFPPHPLSLTPIMVDSEKASAVEQQSDAPETVEPIKPTQTVDTVHKDEAMKVLAAYTGSEEWTEQEEKKLRRKLDWKLLPVLCVTYGLQYYDKAMLSQAVCIILL